MAEKKNAFYSGTSGLVLPFKNKAAYPPSFQGGSRLNFYASLYSSIEINSSFYRIPLARTVEKWTTEVPAGFRFTFKLWKGITHARGLFFKEEDVLRFMEVISRAGDYKGALLVQFPPSLTSLAFMQVQLLLDLIRVADPEKKWDLAFEFRHSSWTDQEVYDLLNDFSAGLVIQDKYATGLGVPESTPDFIYLRFHGPSGDYRGSYTDDFLEEYALYIQQWKEQGKTVYAYFNNTIGNASENLQALNAFVARGSEM